MPRGGALHPPDAQLEQLVAPPLQVDRRAGHHEPVEAELRAAANLGPDAVPVAVAWRGKRGGGTVRERSTHSRPRLSSHDEPSALSMHSRKRSSSSVKPFVYVGLEARP